MEGGFVICAEKDKDLPIAVVLEIVFEEVELN